MWNISKKVEKMLKNLRLKGPFHTGKIKE